MARTNETLERVKKNMAAEIEFAAGSKHQPKPSQSRSFTTADGMAAKFGRLPDGRWYVDLCYQVDEAYDDDFGSRTCVPKCPFAARPHQHYCRVAESLDGLRSAETLAHSVGSLVASA